jgi:subtilisin family serine protease
MAMSTPGLRLVHGARRGLAVMAGLLLANALAAQPVEEEFQRFPAEIRHDPDQVYDYFNSLRPLDQDLADLDQLDPAVADAVRARLAADESAREERSRTLQREAAEADAFDASLKAMAGDQWAAEFAAFFTSTLFAPDTPFESAYGQNLQTLREVTKRTPAQIASDAALARQNAAVAGRQAEARDAAAASDRRQFQTAYGREARQLIGPGYADLGAEVFHKTAALQTQDAHMGQLLQTRAQLNTLRIGDGTVTPGNFTTMTGAESFTRLSDLNEQIGNLRAAGGNEAQIAALEAERTRLLAIDGVADGAAVRELRGNVLEGLKPLAADVEAKKRAWDELADQRRQYLKADERLYDLRSRGPPPGTNPAMDARFFEQWQADIAAQEAIRSNPIEESRVQAAEQAYLQALGRSPLLAAPVDPWGEAGSFFASDITLWEYLGSRGDGRRSAATDDLVLDQAITFVDQATGQVIDAYGTLVTTVPLLDAYGSPVFAGLRAQVAADLSGIDPGVAVNMDALSSLWAANQASTALSRTVTDVGIGFVQITIGTVIFVFPVTAPVLVPVEIALTAGQVGLEGYRTYVAWEDFTRADQAAAAGSGASLAGARYYSDLFGAQAGSFVLVAGMAPFQAAGSVLSLGAAKSELRAAAASRQSVAAADAAPTAATAGAVASTPAGAALPDFQSFSAMTPAQQVAAVKGLPAAEIGGLVERLGRTERTLFAIAWEQDALSANLIASVRQGDLWLESIDGNLQPVTAATRNATDQEILARLSPFASDRDRIVLSREAREVLFLREVGDDTVGPFASFPPMGPLDEVGLNSFPAPGTYTANLSAAEIDALLAKVGPLTREETLLKADLLLQGYGRNRPVMPGWNAPVTDAPANPFQPFPAAGMLDSRAGTLGGVGDDALDGVTEVIPNRQRNPNRTALLGEPDLPPETLIYDPFVPPAAGLLDLPFGLGRLIAGDPLPVRFWTTGEPAALRARGPLEFATVDPPAVTTIVHVVPPSPRPATGAGATVTLQPWAPFVIKMFPIGCRFLPDGEADCTSSTHVFVLNYPAAVANRVNDALGATPGVVHTEDNAARAVQVNDPYYASRGSWRLDQDDQWALKHVGLRATLPAWVRAGAGAPVTVAVIDTGVAWNHRDLGPGSLWINPRERPGNRRDDDGNGYVDDVVGWNFVERNNLPWDFAGHGTLVAGIIAAGRDNGIGVAGVNPGARIMVLKAMNEAGLGRAADVAEAIVYAADNGARVINLSVGGRTLTRTEQLAIDYAAARGALVVAAAGNDGLDLADYGPGGAGRALTVAASDAADRILPSSNHGAAVDLAAPGTDVLGPRAMGTDLLAGSGVQGYRRGANVVGPDAGYIHATGTSFAAPLVAGVASLLVAARPDLGPEQVGRMLRESAVDLGTPGVDLTSGYGRLDAAAALAADPAFFVAAEVQRVAVTAGAVPRVQVIGTADADRFASARVELGAGDEPARWTLVPPGLSAPVRSGVLAEIDPVDLAGAGRWTIRVVTRHANGREREGRFLLTLQ